MRSLLPEIGRSVGRGLTQHVDTSLQLRVTRLSSSSKEVLVSGYKYRLKCGCLTDSEVQVGRLVSGDGMMVVFLEVGARRRVDVIVGTERLRIPSST